MITSTIVKPGISSAAARLLVQAAEAEAHTLRVAVVIAVVDEAGLLKAFSRMDGAPFLSGDIARDKAIAASSFGVPTHLWYDRIAAEPALVHGLSHATGFTLLGGGVPIQAGEALIGGLGVSGASAEQDLAIAEAALRMLADRSASPA